MAWDFYKFSTSTINVHRSHSAYYNLVIQLRNLEILERITTTHPMYFVQNVYLEVWLLCFKVFSRDINLPSDISDSLKIEDHLRFAWQEIPVNTLHYFPAGCHSHPGVGPGWALFGRTANGWRGEYRFDRGTDSPLDSLDRGRTHEFVDHVWNVFGRGSTTLLTEQSGRIYVQPLFSCRCGSNVSRGRSLVW